MRISHALTGAALSLLVWALPGCGTRDCAEERAGQVRCVSNQVEVCNDDGSLTYEPCSPRGLFCSELRGACVTEEVLQQEPTGSTTTGSGGGAGGTGGAGGS